MLRYLIFFGFLCFPFLTEAAIKNSTLLDKAEAGNFYAQLKLARNSFNGTNGVDQDKKEAFKWAYRAARNNECEGTECPDSYNFLAYLYFQDLSIEKNFEKAAHWYEKAASLGHEGACVSLAKMFAEGKGVKLDYPSAYYWYSSGVPKNVKTSDTTFRDSLKNKISPEMLIKLEQKAGRDRAILYEQIVRKAQAMLSGDGLSDQQKLNRRLWLEVTSHTYDAKGIENIIKSGANVNSNSEYERDRTLLMEAAKAGRVDVIKLLLQNGADINTTNLSGNTALDIAISHRQTEAALFLIKSGIMVDNVDDVGDKPIKSAEMLGDTKVVEILSAKSNGKKVTNLPAVASPQDTKPSEVQNKKVWDDISSTFKNGTPDEKEAAATEIKNNSGVYNPGVLIALSQFLFNQYKDDDGAFWFVAANKRANYDGLRCLAKYNVFYGSANLPYVIQAQQYFKDNPKKIGNLYSSVAAWDEKTSYEYDPKWIFKNRPNYDNIPENASCHSEARQMLYKEAIKKTFVSGNGSYSSDYKIPPPPEVEDFLGKAEKGDKQAQYDLSRAYDIATDLSMEVREREAMKWIQKSSEQKYPPAMVRMGELYFNGPSYFYRNGTGADADKPKAKAILLEAGALGYPASYFTLGQLLQQDRNNRPAVTEATAWMAFAEKMGYVDGYMEYINLEASLTDEELQKSQQLSNEFLQKYKK